VTPKSNIAKTAGDVIRQQSLITSLLCCDAVRSAILATAWLFVVKPCIEVDEYPEELLKTDMLPANRSVAGDTYMYQQDNARAPRPSSTLGGVSLQRCDSETRVHCHCVVATNPTVQRSKCGTFLPGANK